MAKISKDVCCAPSGSYKPRLYISLEGQDVAQIKELKVGDKVELKVTGKVVGISQRERNDYDDKKKVVKTGDIDLEGYRVEVMEDEPNEFKDLAEDKEE